MNKIQKALIEKDIKEITSSKQIIIPMIIVPVIMIIILPTILVLAAKFSPRALDSINGIDMLLNKLPQHYKSYSSYQLMLVIALDYMFPAFFLIIPVMLSSIMGASSFVGEREHNTMETLLYTPISMEELTRAKILGVFIPSYIITLVAFVLFGIVMNIGGLDAFNRIIFPSIKWLLIILWLSPALCIFALTFTILISAKSKTFQEAQQLSGFLVIPIIFLLVGQSTGVFLLGEIGIFLIGGILFILDYLLIKKISKGFIPEKLI